MRIIVYGVGAIGGTIAAALALSGQAVIGIARGAQREAIADHGLVLHTPGRTERAHFPCVSDPAEIAFASDDMILLTMKSQDTVAALDRLRMAGVDHQPIFCVQNGVSNERFALRRFPEVHSVTVRMPSSVPTPGEVCAFSLPRHGICDIGRYPAGCNQHDAILAHALEAANIAAFVAPDVMPSKFGKLLHNLHNIVEAAVGDQPGHERFDALLRAEAEATLAAAGIPWREVGSADPLRNDLMRYQPIAGIEHSGTSTTQSLVRGAGSIETDYLNGEIVMLGRLHSVPVPVNAFFVDLSLRMLRDKSVPGSIAVAQIDFELAAAGVAL